MSTSVPTSDSGPATFADVLSTSVTNPFPAFAERRRDTPVFAGDMLEAVEGKGGGLALPGVEMPPMFTVFGYDEVSQILKDPATFSSSSYGFTIGLAMGETILQMDPPQHGQHRSLVTQAFRPRLLEQRAPELIQPVLDEMIDAFVDTGRADLVADLTLEFPVKVIARILGLPVEDYPWFRRKSFEVIGMLDDFEGSLAASQELLDYFGPLVEDRRQQPEDDLISELVQAEVEGQRLTDDEIFGFLRLLLPAGAETTYRSTSNMLYLLLSDPDQLEALRRDRGLMRDAIEEAIRYEPPLNLILRIALQDAEVGGTAIPAGSLVALIMGAANRDERIWGDRGEQFDIHREVKPHLSFATGPHTCLGMHLARAEMRMAVDTILDRLPGLRLDPDDPVEIEGLVFRSPPRLPVLFDVPAA